jgi:hypothetical protein
VTQCSHSPSCLQTHTTSGTLCAHRLGRQYSLADTRTTQTSPQTNASTRQLSTPCKSRCVPYPPKATHNERPAQCLCSRLRRARPLFFANASSNWSTHAPTHLPTYPPTLLPICPHAPTHKCPPTPQHTVNTWLHDAGYETMLCGKYMNGYHGSNGHWATYVPQGWTDWMGFQVRALACFFYMLRLRFCIRFVLAVAICMNVIALMFQFFRIRQHFSFSYCAFVCVCVCPYVSVCARVCVCLCLRFMSLGQHGLVTGSVCPHSSAHSSAPGSCHRSVGCCQVFFWGVSTLLISVVVVVVVFNDDDVGGVGGQVFVGVGRGVLVTTLVMACSAPPPPTHTYSHTPTHNTRLRCLSRRLISSARWSTSTETQPSSLKTRIRQTSSPTCRSPGFATRTTDRSHFSCG